MKKKIQLGEYDVWQTKQELSVNLKTYTDAKCGVGMQTDCQWEKICLYIFYESTKLIPCKLKILEEKNYNYFNSC